MPETEQNIKKDLSVPMTRANLYSIFFAIPAAVILIAGYLVFWGTGGLTHARFLIYKYFYLSVVILISGILLHELLHGLTWIWFGKKAIHTIYYGINLKVLSPYAHCREPLNIQAYRWGAAMPGLILGIIPALLGIITGNGIIMLFGLLFTVAAGGDAFIIWSLRKESSHELVLDHPKHAGCLIIEPSHDQTNPQSKGVINDEI